MGSRPRSAEARPRRVPRTTQMERVRKRITIKRGRSGKRKKKNSKRHKNKSDPKYREFHEDGRPRLLKYGSMSNTDVDSLYTEDEIANDILEKGKYGKTLSPESKRVEAAKTLYENKFRPLPSYSGARHNFDEKSLAVASNVLDDIMKDQSIAFAKSKDLKFDEDRNLVCTKSPESKSKADLSKQEFKSHSKSPRRDSRSPRRSRSSRRSKSPRKSPSHRPRSPKYSSINSKSPRKSPRPSRSPRRSPGKRPQSPLKRRTPSPGRRRSRSPRRDRYRDKSARSPRRDKSRGGPGFVNRRSKYSRSPSPRGGRYGKSNGYKSLKPGRSPRRNRSRSPRRDRSPGRRRDRDVSPRHRRSRSRSVDNKRSERSPSKSGQRSQWSHSYYNNEETQHHNMADNNMSWHSMPVPPLNQDNFMTNATNNINIQLGDHCIEKSTKMINSFQEVNINEEPKMINSFQPVSVEQQKNNSSLPLIEQKKDSSSDSNSNMEESSDEEDTDDTDDDNDDKTNSNNKMSMSVERKKKAKRKSIQTPIADKYKSTVKMSKQTLEVRVVEEVKKWLDPYYRIEAINRDVYKEIVAKCVHKVVSIESGSSVDGNKIRKLVDGYVQVYRHRIKKMQKSF